MYKKKFKVVIDQNHKKIVKACFLLFFFMWIALKIKKIYFVDLYQLFIC